jgi:hypothetical protein
MTRNCGFVVRVLLVLGLLAFIVPVASAQVVGGAIAGTVRDTTGAVMPGVTVEASSPALIEQTRSAVTDDQGNYRLTELRPGLYDITFTLPGFSVVKREGVELTTGFTANISAELRVGGLEETITVAGASPVVDVQNVRQQNNFSRELLDALPTNRSVAGFATLTLGAQLNDPRNQNVGGNQSEALSGAGFTVHGGRSADQKLMQDGMPSTDASFSGNTNRNAINPVAVQETVFQVGGMGAEAETGGVQINVIPKEGGNNFSYYFNGNGTGPKLQATNGEDLGIEVGKVRKVWDFGGAMGGPINRDKLWFFAATRNWGSQNYSTENHFNAKQNLQLSTERPASSYLGVGKRLGNLETMGVLDYAPGDIAYTNGYLRDWFTTRITYQATEKQKWNFSQNLQNHCDCYRGVDTGLTSPESVVQRIYGPSWVTQASWNYPRTSRLLFEGGNTWVSYLSETGRPPGVSSGVPNTDGTTIGDVAIIELTGWDRGSYFIPANYTWGAAVSATTNYAPPYKLFMQTNQRFVTSYITGSHTFKVGVTTMEGWNRDRTELNNVPVRLRLSGGVPNGIDEYTELENTQRLKLNLGFFFQDQWTMDRLTLNLGLRYSHYDAFVPAQTIRAPLNDENGRVPEGRNSMFLSSQLGPNGTVFDRVDHVPYWKDWTPRVGAAFDVFGNGRTAVKGAIGKYVAYVGLTEIPRFNAPGRRLATTARRTWNDDNRNYIPDCDLPNRFAQDNRATGGDRCGQVNNLNIGQLVSSTTYSDEVLHDAREFNWQGSVSVQQQLFPGVALNVGYFRTWYGNLQATANTAQTAADYDEFCVTAPTDARLGAVSGQRICGLYDLKPARFGITNEVIGIAESLSGAKPTEVYDGVDIAVNGRYGRGGIVQGGVSFGRLVQDSCDVLAGHPEISNVNGFATNGNNPYIAGQSTEPFCRRENGNQTQIKFAGNYPLPWFGIEASATYQNNPGINYSATRQFNRAEILPSLGRNLNDANRVVSIMLPFAENGPRINQLDLRFSKRITMGRARVRGQFDVYNVTNGAGILDQLTDYGTNGASFQQINNVLGARLFKFGVVFEY